MDKISAHELMDRTFLVCEMFQYVSDHSEIENCPEDVRKKVESIQDDLAELYGMFSDVEEAAYEKDKPENPKQDSQST